MSLQRNRDGSLELTAPDAELEARFDREHNRVAGELKWWPKGRRRGLGDIIAAATKVLGIPECGGCKKRRELLNRVRVPGTST